MLLKEAVYFSSFRPPLRRGVVTIKGMLEDQIVQLSAASAIPSFLFTQPLKLRFGSVCIERFSGLMLARLDQGTECKLECSRRVFANLSIPRFHRNNQIYSSDTGANASDNGSRR